MAKTLDELLLGGPGLKGYAFQGDMLCIDCGRWTIRELFNAAGGDGDTTDSGDSSVMPQPAFFPESEQAVHCGNCMEYLYG